MARTRIITPANILHGVHVATATLSKYNRVEAYAAKTVIVPATKPSYYTKCWGKLIPITPMEAAMLRPTGNVMIR